MVYRAWTSLLVLWIFGSLLGCATDQTLGPTVGASLVPSVETTPSIGSVQPGELPGLSSSATTSALSLTPTAMVTVGTVPASTASPAPSTPTPATSFTPTVEVTVADPEVLSSSAAAGFEQVEGEPEERFVLRVDCNVRNNGEDGFVTVVATLFGEVSARETETVFFPQGAEITVSLVFADPALLTGLLQYECEAEG